MFELPKVAQSHRQPDFRLLAGGREGRSISEAVDFAMKQITSREKAMPVPIS